MDRKYTSSMTGIFPLPRKVITKKKAAILTYLKRSTISCACSISNVLIKQTRNNVSERPVSVRGFLKSGRHITNPKLTKLAGLNVLFCIPGQKLSSVLLFRHTAPFLRDLKQ